PAISGLVRRAPDRGVPGLPRLAGRASSRAVHRLPRARSGADRGRAPGTGSDRRRGVSRMPPRRSAAMMRAWWLAPRFRVVALVALAGFLLGAKPKTRKKAVPAAVVAAPSEPAPATDAEPSSDAVAVKVVEVAGNQAYLSPGTKGGVRRGATVTIEGKSYQVVQAT